MFLEIENFLTPAEVQSVIDIARRTKFQDGRTTNPHNTAKVNLMADPNDAVGQQASQIAIAAFQRSEEAKGFTFPKRMATPKLASYGIGMHYGAHTDSAFMPVGPQPLRSDLSCTIFISDPGGYQGGELTIYLGTQDIRLKGKPGSAVFYPSTTIHQVMPVTAGERVVILSFIESQIPDQHQRELLYTLNEVYALEGLKMEWRNATQLQHISANLLRMWSR